MTKKERKLAENVLVFLAKYMVLKRIPTPPTEDGVPPVDWAKMGLKPDGSPLGEDDEDDDLENVSATAEFYWKRKSFLRHDILSVAERTKNESVITTPDGDFVIQMGFREAMQIIYKIAVQ